MPTVLVPALHDAYASLLQRLADLRCPHLDRLPTIDHQPQHPFSSSHANGSTSDPPVDIWDIPASAHAHAVLAQQDDSGFHSSPYQHHLLVRLALVTWLLERYDADLVKICHDLADEYVHTRNNQSVLFQFKRLLKVCLFIGAIPPAAAASSPLHVLTGTATAGVQLTFLHTLVDLIYSLPPRDPFSASASASQYHSAGSYTPAADQDHHRHVHLLHHVANSLAGGAQAASDESVLSDRLDLYPPTLLMAANANRLARDKLKAAHGVPDAALLAGQLQTMRQQVATKQLVLQDLQRQLPLTSNEHEYPAALARLEATLQTFHHLVHQFTAAPSSTSSSSVWSDAFLPLVEPLQAASLRLSPLGSQLSALADEKHALDALLTACSDVRRHYARLLHSPEVRGQMARLATRPELEERAATKLNDLVKTFEQSLARMDKEARRREDRRERWMDERNQPARDQWREKELAASLYRPMKETPKELRQSPNTTMSTTAASSFSPRSSFSSSSPAAAPFSSSSASRFSSSILTSNRDLPLETEATGLGSAGLMSPVAASALPQTMVTRTGAVDARAQEERWRRRDEEERRRVDSERDIAEEVARRSQRSSQHRHQQQLQSAALTTPSKARFPLATGQNTPSSAMQPPQPVAYSPSSYADSQRLTTAQLR